MKRSRRGSPSGFWCMGLQAAHHALSGHIDGALGHGVHPGQHLAAAVGHAGIRIVGHRTADAGTLRQQKIHTPDLAAAAGEGDAVLGNVTHQLRRGLFPDRCGEISRCGNRLHGTALLICRKP